MLIKTSSVKGPFRVYSGDEMLLSTQSDFDCALAYAQGILDNKFQTDNANHEIKVAVDRHLGHRADEFLAIHVATTRYTIRGTEIPNALSVLAHCTEISLHKSFVVEMSINPNFYAFDRNNERANEIYDEERLREK